MMSHDRHRQRTLERLEEFGGTYPAEIMYMDGRLEIGHVQGVAEGYSGYPVLLHGKAPLDPNTYYGSIFEASDIFTNTPLFELGYVRDPATGEKISLMPFQLPKKDAAVQ